MKVIDASEVEGLNRAQAERERRRGSVQSRKLERKRKLLADAAASGLRSRDRKGARTHAPAAAADDGRAGGASGAAERAAEAEPPSEDSQWESLLERSNKLSDGDRKSV